MSSVLVSAKTSVLSATRLTQIANADSRGAGPRAGADEDDDGATPGRRAGAGRRVRRLRAHAREPTPPDGNASFSRRRTAWANGPPGPPRNGRSCRDLDRRGRDHLEVDPSVASVRNIFARRFPGATACPAPISETLPRRCSRRSPSGPSVPPRRRSPPRGGGVVLRDRERQLGDAVDDVLEDRVDVDVLLGDRLEDGRRRDRARRASRSG